MTAAATAATALPTATLILSRHEIAALMTPGAWLDAVEAGFSAAAAGRAHAPSPMAIEAEDGAFHAKAAWLGGAAPLVALKLNGNFPGNRTAHGLPTIQGGILLCCGTTGMLLAIMDSIEVTLRRTAAASALAARFLARPESHRILICGCGEQGGAHLAALRDVLPLDQALVWDRDPGAACRFADRFGDATLAIDAVDDLGEAAARSDVIVTCTTATVPFLTKEIVQTGTFIAAVGADSPGKSEIAPDLMRHALVVTDVADQCAVMGDLHHALATGVMTRENVHANLAQLVTGERPGRTTPDQITLFDSTGTALQDVASAAEIHRRALRGGLGTIVMLGGME